MNPSFENLPERASNTLLCRLRDLNLTGRMLSMPAVGDVAIAGCLSIYSPVKGGVRYRLSFEDGTQRLFGMQIEGGSLELTLSDPLAGSEPGVRRRMEIRKDEEGLALVSEADASVDPETTDAIRLARFLERVIGHFLRSELGGDQRARA